MKKKGMLCHLFDKTHEKIWMIMKLCIIFVVFLTFTTYAKSSGQEQTVSLKLNQASFYELFEAIRQQTGLRFLYNADQLKQMPVVNVSADNKKVRDVLTDVLFGTPLTFMFDKDVVMLVKRTDAAQQQKTVKILGQVTDEKKQPLPGVTIMVKGTKVGTATDKDGKYRFTAPQTDNLTFIYSFIGMIPVEVKYTGKDTINVVMKEEVASLDEVQVVATGYQTVNRRDMVGAYKTVKADDIMMPSYTSIDKMLQGQVAGMIVTNSSSRVGSSPNIQIRGTSTLLGNTAPLWVVDGIIQPDPINLTSSAQMTQGLTEIIGNQISWLNPTDIETLTVLKDASATAIYGSKASNGVIVITTKRGKADRLTVNYRGDFSFTARPTYDRFNVMNSQERVMFSDEALEWGSYSMYSPIKQTNTYEGIYRMYIERDISEADFLQRKKELEGMNTDWFKLLTQNTFSHNHSMGVSGGSEKFTYNASVGYSKEDGQEIGNEGERYTARIAFDAKLRKNITLAVSANGTSSKNLGFAYGVDPFSYASKTSRAIPAFDERGDLLFYQTRATYSYNNNVQSLGYNIMNERDNTGSSVRTFNVVAAADFKWEIISGLTYQFTGGYNHTSKNNETFATERSYYVTQKFRGYDYGTKSSADPEFKATILPFGGILYTNDVTQGAYNVQNKLLISKNFNADNRLNAMIGMELRSSHNMYTENTVYGYMPDKGHKLARPTNPKDIVPIGYGTAPVFGPFEEMYPTYGGRGSWSKSDQTDNYFSWFATLAYSFKDRYVVNVNVRNDASNRFGQDVTKRLDPTYSFGVSWRASEEAFVREKLSWIGNLNLRATYGIQGNALSNKSNDLILEMNGIESTYNEYYSTISAIPNPHLSWERTTSWNFGMDMDLFNIFSVNAEYYRRSSNAIIGQDIAFEYGMTYMELNGGLIDNNGVEVTVAFTPVKRKDFVVSLSVNSSKNWNKTGKPVVAPSATAMVTPSSEKIYYEGYPVNSFWSYSFAGLNGETGMPMFNYLDVPADQRDPNMDPTKFMVYSGQQDPYFTGGLELGIRYKSLVFSSSFSLLLGGHKRLSSPYSNFGSDGAAIPEAYSNLSRDLLKRWKNPGDEANTNIPGLRRGNISNKLTAPDNYSSDIYSYFYKYSDALVVDASFLRCRQMGLTWNMDRELCNRLGVKTLSLSATVGNVFVIASDRFQGFDPELDNSVAPRTYSLSINVGF